MKLIYTFINLKNMIVNSVLVRFVWLIIGALGGLAALAMLDISYENQGLKPRFFRDSVLHGKKKEATVKKVTVPVSRKKKTTE